MWKPWRLVAQGVSSWSRTSNAVAVSIAREAAVECSRIAVERAEVTLFLDAAAARPSYAAAK